MITFINWLLRNLVCPFKGHVPEKFLTETDEYICTKRCKRCKAPLGMGHWKIINQCTPPWCSDHEWTMFCEEKNQEIRDSV